MKVIKKDGRIQDFSIEKIKTSLMNSSNDINEHLSNSDAEFIAKKVQNKIQELRGDEGLTSSWEIRSLLIHTLSYEKYQSLAKHFMRF